MKEKISYDAEEDILYYNKGSAVQDTLDIGNFFIEFSGDGEIVGMEILEASDTISELTDQSFSPDDLAKANDAEIKMFVEGDFVFVTLFFTTEKKGEIIKERIGVNVPTRAVSA